MRGSVTIQDTVDLLNELLKLDTLAVQKLIGARVPCNAALADHPTVQVVTVTLTEGRGFEVGLLGVLNGLFGVDAAGWGPIGACYNDKNELVTFAVR